MGVKHAIWNLTRHALSALPISPETYSRLRDTAYTLLGERAAGLPGHTLWKIQRDAKKTPSADAQRTPAQLWAEHYASDARPTFLFVSHDMGGGTEQHVVFLKDALEKEGIRVLALRHGDPKSNRMHLHGFAPNAGQRMEFGAADFSALVALLKRANLRHIHVHHTLHMPDDILSIIENLSCDLGVPYDFTAHDYLAICPRFTLYQDGTGGYCGEPDIKGCAGCLATYDSPFGRDVDMAKWRAEYGRFLNRARSVFTPDKDVTDRLLRYFPDASIKTRPHQEVFSGVEPFAGTREKDGLLKVVVLGAIAPHKGASIIYDCAEDALKRGLKLHFTVIGYTSEDWKRRPHANMTITGAYTDAQLHDWLKDSGFHLSFFPAVWPETYSYTLSLAMRYGLHPVSFDLGAIGRRIAAAAFGTILPYRDFRSPGRINDALLAIRPQTPPADLMEKNFSHYENYIRDYYGLPETVKA